jgi:hypothetical protein
MGNFFRWTGSTDGDLNDVTNWDDGIGGAADHIPAAGDDIMFSTGAVDVTINPEYFAAILLHAVYITDDYTGSIATSGTYMKFLCEELYVEGASATTHYLWIPSDNDTKVIVTATGTAVYIKAVVDDMTLQGGSTYLLGTTINNSLLISNPAAVDIASDCTLTGTCTITGGSCDSDTAHGTVEVKDGLWTQADGSGTTLNMYGGTYKFNAAQHRLETAEVYGGFLNCGDSPDPKTIGTLTLGARGKLNLNNGNANIVVENGITTYGGQIEFSPGSRLMVSPVELP